MQMLTLIFHHCRGATIHGLKIETGEMIRHVSRLFPSSSLARPLRVSQLEV
jgi:hypothetical protein